MRASLFGLVALWSLGAGALCSAATPTGAAFLAIPLSVRQLGMGNVGIGEDDILRAWTNPALLVGLGGRGVVAGNGSSLLGGGRSMGLGAGWQVAPGWAVGGMFLSSAISFQEVDALADPVGKNFTHGLTSGGVLVATRPAEWLRVGGALKFVRDELGADVGKATALDAGLVAEQGRVSGAIALRNLGTALRPADDVVSSAERLAAEARVGMSYELLVRQMNIALEYVSAANHDAALDAGVEWWAIKGIGLRAGVSALQTLSRKLTAGVTVARGPMSVDYAFSTQQLGMMHHVSIAYVFGGLQQAAAGQAPSTVPQAAVSVPAPVIAPQGASATAAAVSAAAPGSLGAPRHFAVANLEEENVLPGEAEQVADILRQAMGQATNRAVMGQREMEESLAQSNLPLSGCASEECAKPIGQSLGVRVVLFGRLSRDAEAYYLSVFIWNTGTGESSFGGSAKGATFGELAADARNLAGRIGGRP